MAIRHDKVKQDQPTAHKGPQTPEWDKLDRKDHIWTKLTDKMWKCCLCGAVTCAPPAYPSPVRWTPERYEGLTDEERRMVRR